MSMDLIILALILGCHIVALVWAARMVKSARQFLTAPGTDKPSPLAEAVSHVSTIFAVSIAKQVQMSMMGQASALSKATAGAEQDIARDMLANKNPLLSTLLDFSPKLRNRLLRSPAAAIALSGLNLGALGGNHGPKPTSGNGHDENLKL